MLSTEAMIMMEDMVNRLGEDWDLVDVMDALSHAGLKDNEIEAMDYAAELSC